MLFGNFLKLRPWLGLGLVANTRCRTSSRCFRPFRCRRIRRAARLTAGTRLTASRLLICRLRSCIFTKRHFSRRTLDYRLRSTAIKHRLFGSRFATVTSCLMVLVAIILVVAVVLVVVLVVIAVAVIAVVVVAIHVVIAIIFTITITIIEVLTLFALEPFLHLRLSAGNDTVIVLGMLQIVLSNNPVARALRITRKLSVFLGYMLGCTPDLHIRTRTVIASGQGIRSLAVVIVVIPLLLLLLLLLLFTPAAALVLLSWPHQFVT